MEPYDPSTTPYPTRQQQMDISPPVQQNQYFTNSIPFKQEPSEPIIKQELISYNESPTTSSNNNNENAALNIVNHLLKDQQILNQLEKVAQSFRLN